MKNHLPQFLLLTFALGLFWNCASSNPQVESVKPHAEQMQEYGANQPIQEPYKVLTGLDVLIAKNFEILKGLKVGVVTNHTAVSKSGEHLVDLLHARSDIEVRAIFAPEHGFRGDEEGGNSIPGSTDLKTGIPIHSLYGSNRQPTAEMMEGIEMLIFDIQDVGTRFYTYISTMGYVLEAGAAYNIPVMILDRPNPIGRAVAGNVLDDGFESFVGRYKIPIQYGLTMGELARMITGEKLIPGLGDVELHVVECQGWPADAFWQETDLKWLPPSPNMRNTNETLTYPGLCLLEGVRINEGRGTEFPFEYIGAPYMDSKRMAQWLLASGVKGFTVEPVTYTPVDIPGAAVNPLFEGEVVNGVKIKVTDPAAFNAVDFLLHLLVITKANYPEDFGWRSTRGPDRLWGGSALRELVDAGAGVDEIKATYLDELEAFKEIRKKYFIYPDSKASD
jgi:uncharacterized protein YbbC (DUF1343 family)